MTGIRLKPIKTETIAKQIANKIPQALSTILSEAGEGLVKDLTAYTDNWTNKPTFKVSQFQQSINVTMQKAQIFHFVDAGTRPHIIKPKQAGGLLGFRTGYKPKTKVGQPRFKGSGKATGGFRLTKQVKHPGTKARNVSATFFTKWNELARKQIRQRLNIKRLAK
jgi:hypothetical protein